MPASCAAATPTCGTSSVPTTGHSSSTPRPGSGSRTSCGVLRYFQLNPEGFSEGAANVIDRCLMDSMHDEVFIMQAIAQHVPPEVLADIKQALGNMATRSRHVGLELIRVCRSIESL